MSQKQAKKKRRLLNKIYREQVKQLATDDVKREVGKFQQSNFSLTDENLYLKSRLKFYKAAFIAALVLVMLGAFIFLSIVYSESLIRFI